MKKPTPKQEKLINGLIANATAQNKTKLLKTIVLEAGYSENSAKNPQLLTNSPVVLAATQKVITQMERLRDKSIRLASEKAEDAPFNHLIDGADKMIKNIQLLSGKATENTAVNIQISESVANKNA